MDSDDDDDDVHAFNHMNNVAMLAEIMDDEEEGQDPRSKRRNFKHNETEDMIYDLWFADEPLFNEKEFISMFRISKARFHRLCSALIPNNPFYINRYDAFGKLGASPEAKIMIALKSLAFGTTPEAFIDHLRMSRTLAQESFKEFIHAMKTTFEGEFLRVPSQDDLKNILNLHKHQHGVPGMFGSLDCTHIPWKNCPKAHQHAFKGKEGVPTIVLEAACDYNLWMWHAAFGFPGTYNDINILNVSPLVDRFFDGSFAEVESPVVPFIIAQEAFYETFVLVDGIYPMWPRFLSTLSNPANESETHYAAWQESARKDIERCFGILKQRFQVLTVPVKKMNPKKITDMVATCIILHNMMIQDSICGVEAERYNPADGIGQSHEGGGQQSADGVGVGEEGEPILDMRELGLLNAPDAVRDSVVDRYAHMTNPGECTRLRKAVVRHLWSNRGGK